MTKRTTPSIGELVYEFFLLPTLRVERRPDRVNVELCWLNRYIGIVRNYWED